MDAIDLLTFEHRQTHAERSVRFHRDHTVAEALQVFPLAWRLLPPEVLERVRARFARIEGTHGGPQDAADAVELAFPLDRGALRGAWSARRAR